jgi:hypothetical protein
LTLKAKSFNITNNNNKGFIMNNKSCPISLVSVDSNIARINAFYVGLIFSIFLVTQSSALVFFLILDFVTRIFLNKEYSLLFILSKNTKNILKLETIKVDAAPKKLASLFGLVFLVTIAILYVLNLTLLFYIFSGILLACIFLEVAFSYCLGCEIYHIYKRVFV